MNTHRTRIAITTAIAACAISAAAIAPAQAKTHRPDAGGATTSSQTTYDIGEIIAIRKAQMAADYITWAGQHT
jgi:hypothetical protein